MSDLRDRLDQIMRNDTLFIGALYAVPGFIALSVANSWIIFLLAIGAYVGITKNLSMAIKKLMLVFGFIGLLEVTNVYAINQWQYEMKRVYGQSKDFGLAAEHWWRSIKRHY